VFSVTPEPAVSKLAYDPQARQARADQPSPDGFAALVESNAAATSETDRPARPVQDAPRREARGPDTPAADRSQSDPAAASSSAGGDPAKQSTTSATPTETAVTGEAPDKAKTATGDISTEDKPQDASTDGGAAATVVAPVIPAIVSDPVAIVIAAATSVAPVSDENIAATTVTATAAIASASAIANASALNTPAGTSAAQAADVVKTATAAATLTTSATAPAVEVTAPETTAPVISAAATVIKSGVGKTEIITKDGEATAPAKDSKDGKQATDPSAKPVPDQAIKLETGAANTDDKPEQLQQATPDSTKTETEKHAGKTAPQAEHHAAAPTPQQTLLTDPGLQSPLVIQPQPIQIHAANLTAVPVPPANTALADSVPVPLNGLAADIALRAAGGNSRFEIRLDPAELGRIDVRLDVDKHGNVTSHLTVERPATLDMLRRDAPQLQQALEDAGLKTGDSGLQFSLRDQSSSGGDSENGPGRNSQRVVITEEDTVPAQVAGRTYGRMLGASSGVDIRI
jgi:flagellar hook-length control protein FliK